MTTGVFEGLGGGPYRGREQDYDAQEELRKVLKWQDANKVKTPQDKIRNLVKEALTARGYSDAEAEQIISRIESEAWNDHRTELQPPEEG